MINSEAVQQIGKLWSQAVDQELASTFPAIQQMSDTATEVVDRIIETTWTQGREMPLEAMDQMRELAIAGDEAGSAPAPEVDKSTILASNEALRRFSRQMYSAIWDVMAKSKT